MKKINELYSLDWASDCYYVNNNLEIINKDTNKIKSQSVGKRGYKYVTLNRKSDNVQIKVYVHKIIALAFINNGEYECINHKDGNKLNNAIDNLEFCTNQENIIHAWNNNLIVRNERVFKIAFNNGTTKINTMKELQKETGISRITLYDLYYKNKGSKKWSIKQIEEYFGSQETIE